MAAGALARLSTGRALAVALALAAVTTARRRRLRTAGPATIAVAAVAASAEHRDSGAMPARPSARVRCATSNRGPVGEHGEPVIAAMPPPIHTVGAPSRTGTGPPMLCETTSLSAPGSLPWHALSAEPTVPVGAPPILVREGAPAIPSLELPVTG